MKRLKNIKLKENNTSIVWKSDTFNAKRNTTISVPFSYEAICLKDGVAGISLKSGNHKLIDYYRLEKKDEFAIFYIKNNASIRLSWGTPTQIDIIDPVLNMPVRLGASGEFHITITNPRMFLVKVVGDQKEIGEEDIKAFYRERLSHLFKDAISKVVIEDNICFYEITSKLAHISNHIKFALKETFAEYGNSLDNFSVSKVAIPEKVREAIEEAFLKRTTIDIEEGKVTLNEKKISKKVKETKDETNKVKTKQVEKPKNKPEIQIERSKKIVITE